MTKIALKRGDVFCAAGQGPLFWGIRLVQYIHSRDNESTYGHAAMILCSSGDVLDTRWTVSRTSLDLYRGQKIIIARPIGKDTPDSSLQDIDHSHQSHILVNIENSCKGKWYPVHRLALHLIPPLAKFLHIGRWSVCSERVAQYLNSIGARNKAVGGTTPDMLADEWRRWRNFDIIYEGVWDSALLDAS